MYASVCLFGRLGRLFLIENFLLHQASGIQNINPSATPLLNSVQKNLVSFLAVVWKAGESPLWQMPVQELIFLRMQTQMKETRG